MNQFLFKIGSLNPREKCDSFGIFNNRAMVRYMVDGTKNYKIGFFSLFFLMYDI